VLPERRPPPAVLILHSRFNKPSFLEDRHAGPAGLPRRASKVLQKPDDSTTAPEPFPDMITGMPATVEQADLLAPVPATSTEIRIGYAR